MSSFSMDKVLFVDFFMVLKRPKPRESGPQRSDSRFVARVPDLGQSLLAGRSVVVHNGPQANPVKRQRRMIWSEFW